MAKTPEILLRLERIEANQINMITILTDMSNKMDIANNMDEKKAPKERKMDILTFIKNEYIKNQGFFDVHFGPEAKEALFASMPQPKKTISAEEQRKKEAMAIWKELKKDPPTKAYYEELKLKAINGSNPDIPDASGKNIPVVIDELDEED